jgi:aryl carrier-like protein
VKIGGERALAERFVAWWRRLPPGVGFVNAYGPTETTVAATRCLFPGEVAVDERLVEMPIGRPYPHARVYLLDRHLRLVPPGVAGELCIGGAGLARGYLGRPALTAERFVPDPFAAETGAAGNRLYRSGDLVRFRAGGVLEYLGRTDAQLKVRGFRIEPGEIEAALGAHPGVAEAAVVAVEGAAERGPGGAVGDRRLVAYYVPAEGAAPDPAALAAHLAARLPAYMVPTAFVALAAMPLNAHGKVDRRALPALAAPPRPAAAHAPPGNQLEATIAGLWGELLGVAEVGVEDNFFEAGGSSLLLVQLHSRLQQVLGRDLRLVEIFEHPTVRALAAWLGAAVAPQATVGEARQRTETRRESMRQLRDLRQRRREGR